MADVERNPGPGTGGHIVRSYDADIEALRTRVAEMGGHAETQIRGAIRALIERDADAALKVVAADAQLDQLEVEAESEAVALIALRSPMADDLREIVAGLKIAAVIERIGDYAKNIAKRVPVLVQSAPVEPSAIIPEMGRAAGEMVRLALDAYVDRDAALAIEVCERDAQVDDLYVALFRSLLTYMMENPHHITSSAHLLFVAKNLERIGDHATNIAETVHFGVTGERMADRSRGGISTYDTRPIEGE